MRHRRALIVGIDRYAAAPDLVSCCADARAIRDLLARNDDGSVNFTCEILTSQDPAAVTRALLRTKWVEHLAGSFEGDVLFYFSGHAVVTHQGGVLLTQDGSREEPGLPMNELVDLANRSKARTVLIILDCCFAGAAGGLGDYVENRTPLRKGVTILAAAGPDEKARETDEHGIFTRLLLAGLRGGAADVRGQVSAAALYAYGEAILGALDQRPIYKSHAHTLEPVRRCAPVVHDSVLRMLPVFFKSPAERFRMAPSYERTHPDVIAEHVVIFDQMKELQSARLLRCSEGLHLYDTALASQTVQLTPLGEFYWELVCAGEI